MFYIEIVDYNIIPRFKLPDICGLSLYCGMWIMIYVKFAHGIAGCIEGEFSPHIIQR
jgi:hypothetical protein